MAETAVGEITVNQYSGTVDGITRFGVELAIVGDVSAAAVLDEQPEG